MKNIDPAVHIPSTVVKPTKRPGNGLMQAGALVAFIGFILTVVGASSSGNGPTVGSLLIFVVAFVLVAVGFARRVLTALEK